MSLIRGTDPLALLAIQAGQTPTPGDQRGARGSNPLDVQQVAHKIGDPVPIAFGRRRNGAGGVFISPKATECRFENDTDNDVTAFYHLVLSEGRIGSLQVRDVFQRQCRVGSFTQTYNRRAGTWTPGNAIVVRAGFDKPEATYLCGTVGAYPGMSTLSFQVTIPNGFDVWNRQVHCFVRNGMEVYRWADDTANVSSDSFADLAYWLMVNSARIPVSLIDTDSIESTSVFLNANNITTNCWLTDAINYSELISRWGPYHLLRSSSRNGKAGLKPLLPTNGNGTIKTTALTVEYTFTDDLVIPGSEEIVYSDWASRQPFVAQVVWRQQLDADVGIIRTAEVRYAGTAGTGPYETHDLSQFCTREDHAVKVGAYILAKRVRSTHTMRFKVRPQSHNTIVQQGSIVRVRLERNASGDVPVFHDYLYEVERITRTLAGDIQYDCSHVPVDSQGRSLIARDVANATGAGILLTSNLTGLGCDLNSFSDTSIPSETFTPPPSIPGDGLTPIDPGVDTPISGIGGGGSGGGGGGGGGGALPEPDPVPDDELDEYQAGIYFHSATWSENVLTIAMRLAPTGRAPREDLGSLDVTIASTSVVALLPNGTLADPQPESLPSISFTGQIAEPWDAIAEGLPVPPADRIFEGQFILTFESSAFPPLAGNPAEQLTYRAIVEFTDWNGGFTDVSFMNNLIVDFVLTEIGWSPSSLSPSAWYDASRAADMTVNETRLSQWNDRVGTGRFVTAADESEFQPTYGVATLNSLGVATWPVDNAVTFPLIGNTRDDYITESAASVFAVFKVDTLYSPQSFADRDVCPIRLAGGNFGIAVNSSTGGAIVPFAWALGYSSQPTVSLPYTAGEWAIVEARQSGTTLSGRLNAGSAVSTGCSGIEDPLDQILRIGDDSETGSMVGGIAEILVFNSSLGSLDRQKIEGYLAHKWGLDSLLPVGHPYKSEPPPA